MKKVLDKKAFEVKTTNRLESHPCVVTVQDMASARHFIRTQSQKLDENSRYLLLQPRFEINPNHPIIQKLVKISNSDSILAELLTKQVKHFYFSNFHRIINYFYFFLCIFINRISDVI